MLDLVRDYKEDRTEGSIFLPSGQTIFTLERPDLNNKPFVSCIPEGIYVIERNTTGKHQYYGVTNVTGRSHIEIHPANYVHQLEGCIAPCLSLKNGVAYQSEDACELLLSLFENHSWVLRITSK